MKFYLPSQQNTPTSTGGEMNAGFVLFWQRKMKEVQTTLPSFKIHHSAANRSKTVLEYGFFHCITST